jgi:nucleoside-diphosphate-sugar epimerase
MRYFITGATGFIGGRVAAHLRAKGHEVVALVRDRDRARRLVDVGVRIVEGDIADKSSMRKAMIGADGVFHVAGWYRLGTREPGLATRVNVEGTANVLSLMKELGVRKGVYTSTLAVFSDTRGEIVDERYRYNGPHLSEYDRSKWRAHFEVAEPMMRNGLPLVIVMPGLVYGPGDTGLVGETLRDYLRGRLRLLPRRTAFCWAHVDDVAHGHLLAMERGAPGESYIIAGPPHTLIEALEIAEEITDIRPPRLHPGPSVMKLMSGLIRFADSTVRLPPLYTRETLRVLAGTTYLGSNSRAVRELGFRPRPLAEGLRETLTKLRAETWNA